MYRILASSPLSRVTDIVTVVGAIIVVVLLVVAGVFIYIIKFRKPKSMKETQKDYSTLNRRDMKDYVRLDDIKDDMIIMNGGRRFVGAIKCYGNEFFDLKAGERLSIKNGYTSFIGAISKPIVYRQSAKAVDLIGHITYYKKQLEKTRNEYVALSVDHEDLKIEAGRLKTANDTESLSLILNAIEITEKKILISEERIKRLEEMLRYMDLCSSGGASIDKDEIYMFSWEYSSGMEGFFNEPTDEDIYNKAKTELFNMANAYISALGSGKVAARRCTTKELEIICYRHFHPVSGAFLSDSEWVENSNDVEIVTSPKMDELFNEYLKEQSEVVAQGSMVGFLKEKTDEHNKALIKEESDRLDKEDSLKEALEEASEDVVEVSEDVIEDNETFVKPVSDGEFSLFQSEETSEKSGATGSRPNVFDL